MAGRKVSCQNLKSLLLLVVICCYREKSSNDNRWRAIVGLMRRLQRPLFKSYVERDLAISGGLLFHWRIQLHHLAPNSILHISIFVHLCEAFLGIHPHFDLFKSLFSLNPHPNGRNIARVGGTDLQLCPEMAEKYIQYTPHHQIRDWRAEWFYIDNHAPAFPERIPGHPQVCGEWFAHGQNEEQEDELLRRIANLRENRVTGVTVMLAWIRRQIQPLKSR